MKFLALAAIFLWIGGVQAAEIKVLSGNGASAAVRELAARFEKDSGHKVTIHFEVNVGVKRRIDAGEPFDVAVLNPPVLDELIRSGRIVGGTRSILGRAGIGMGMKAGAPKPDISTVEGFKRTLLSAKAVAYPGEGASGKYFESLVDKLGIGAEMKPRMKPMPAEYNVEVVASGGADYVVVVASRISGVKGVELVGLIPKELQTWIGFAAGVAAAAKEPDLAHELVHFLVSPAAEPVLRRTGIEPFVE
jgi:molybdate transport system substrate-binding protein